ncbi:hypothetical protein SFRURICE_021381, partial [Spodoptera frugiperda]
MIGGSKTYSQNYSVADRCWKNTLITLGTNTGPKGWPKRMEQTLDPIQAGKKLKSTGTSWDEKIRKKLLFAWLPEEPRWPNGHKCDCRTRGLRYPSRAKYFWVSFQFFENLSVVARSLEMC